MSSTSSIALRWVLGGICLAVVGYLLVSVGHLVKLVIISALLAYIIDPLASALESRGLSRAAATTIIFIVIVGVMSVAFLVIAPVLVKQLIAIQSSFKAGSADAMLQRLERALQAYFTAFDFRDLNLSERLQALTGSAAQWIFAHIMDFVSLLTNIILIPFMVFFFLKDGRQFKKHLVGLVPNRYFELTLNLIYKMDLQLGNYLRGQFLDALIIGVLSTGALWLLNVKYFFLFGAFAGIANLIPYLGPVAGAALAMTGSVIDTGELAPALSIGLAFVVVKLIDDVLIQPTIVARSVNMHPLVVLLAVIVGGQFFGILGMLLSVPATGFLKVATQEISACYRRYQ